MRKILVVALSFLSFGLPVSGRSADLPDPWLLPLKFEASKDPATQQWNFYDFTWRSFIALNWPNVPIEIELTPEGPVIVSGFRGEPDASRSIDVMAGPGKLPLAVWETYKEPFEVFPTPALWEGLADWNIPRTRARGLAGGAEARRLLRYPVGLAEYATEFNQPYFFPFATGPLIDQNGHYVRYEVAVNQAFFTYVRHFGYYDAEAQKQAVDAWIRGRRDSGAFRRPPFGNPAELGPGGYLHNLPPFAHQGMVDVKAAWKVLDTARGDRPERYLHRQIVVDDKGTTQLMGLVALHILRYTPNGYDPEKGIDGAYVASTFEQVDNVSADFDPYPGLKPSFNDGSNANGEANGDNCEFGFKGKVPPQTIVPHPTPVGICRVTELPQAVQEINAVYQDILRDSVFRYYELIGTQNKHQGGIAFQPPSARATNGHEGPITGVYTNTNNLINAALESYTQKNFSCILCHARARPKGVPDKAMEVDHFKILTFLLQSAQSQPSYQ